MILMNNKGQYSNLFGLLIAAIVALVLIAIFFALMNR